MSDEVEVFGHDTQYTFDHRDTGTFDQAIESVEDGEADGVGMALTRHDGILIVEAVEAFDDENAEELTRTVAAIYNSLGKTWFERDTEEDNLARFVYGGNLPTEYSSWAAVRLRFSDGVQLRVYDRGWAPLCGNPLSEGAVDCREVDAKALQRLFDLAFGGGGGGPQ